MNDYYEYSDSLLPGSVAKAEEVAAEFEALQSAFDLVPRAREDGTGFADNIFIPEATEDGHAATWGQLKALEMSAQAANAGATAANTNIQDVLLPDINTKYTSFVSTYADVEAWRDEAEGFRNDAQRWASEDEDTVVESGEYSAKHWALKAAQLTSGARTYIGGWSASGGALPIPTPTLSDAGKFWRITASGTLPQVGAVNVEDELSIKSDLSYEVLPTNSSVQSVNGKTGAVTVTKTDVGLPNVPNYTATDSLTDGSSTKFATAKATGDLQTLVEGAQSTANTAVSNAATAQSAANAAQTSASNAQAAAGTAQNAADSAQSTADTVTSANASLTSTVNGISTTVGAHTGQIATAQATAAQGVSDAANAQSTADDAGTVANNALSAAASAATSASNAQGTANTAVANAAAAQSTADSAVADAASAQSTADAAEPASAATAQYNAITALNNQLRSEFEALLAAYNARWAEIAPFAFNTDIDLNGNDIDGVKRISFPGTAGDGSISRTGTDLNVSTTGDLILSAGGSVSGVDFSDLSGAATAGQVPNLQSLNGAVTAGQVPNLQSLNGVATANQVPNIENLNGSLTEAMLGWAPQVAGHVRAGNTQLLDSTDDSSTVLVAAAQGPLWQLEDTWSDYGPVGSDADRIWARMNDLPANAKFIILDIETSMNSDTSGLQAYITVYGGKEGDTLALDNASLLLRQHSYETNTTRHRARIYFPLSTNRMFKMQWKKNSRTQNYNITFYYRGFITG